MRHFPIRFGFDQSLPGKRMKEKGQALIEFAITLPILILLVFGAINLGRIIYSDIVIINAAHVGAEFLANHPTSISQLTLVVTNEAQNSGVSMDTLVASSSNCCTPYQDVTVTVQACVSNVTLINVFDSLPSCGANGVKISKSVTMMVLP